MKLSLLDRVTILNILPEKGSYETIVVRKELVEKVGIKQTELDEYKIKDLGNGSIQWDTTVEDKDYDLTEREERLVRDSFKEKDRKEELTTSMLDTYEKFR